MNDLSLVCEAVAHISFLVEKVLNKLFWEALTRNRERVKNSLSAAPDMLVIHIVYEVVNSLQFINRFLDDMFPNLEFIALVVALVKLEQDKIVTEQTKIEDTCQKFLEAKAMKDSLCPDLFGRKRAIAYRPLQQQGKPTSLVKHTLSIRLR